jgi:hypothetical protein
VLLGKSHRRGGQPFVAPDHEIHQHDAPELT